MSYFIEGRSSNQCALRWAQINPEIKRGKWSDEEDTVCIKNLEINNLRSGKDYTVNYEIV